MTEKKLMEFTADEEVSVFALLKTADTRLAKNGKKYIAFVFADASGEIAGKYWDASDDDIAKFTVGQVVQLQGKRELYQGTAQIKITGLRLAVDGEPNDPSMYVKKAPMTKVEMQEEIDQTIFEITQPTWNRIVRHLLAAHQTDFFTFPAAKTNHHAYAGGLAFHTISILRLAHDVVKHYPRVNAPLLYAGALIHDLGKTVELSGAVGTTYTLAGNLVGHITLMDGEIVQACQDLSLDPDAEDVLLLRHMVLSHHGLLEYGSPVRPELLEAEVLHDLDELDASIMMLTTALDKTTPGSFTERLFGMDNRRFYQPNQLPLSKPKE